MFRYMEMREKLKDFKVFRKQLYCSLITFPMFCISQILLLILTLLFFLFSLLIFNFCFFQNLSPYFIWPQNDFYFFMENRFFIHSTNPGKDTWIIVKKVPIDDHDITFILKALQRVACYWHELRDTGSTSLFFKLLWLLYHWEFHKWITFHFILFVSVPLFSVPIIKSLLFLPLSRTI